MRARQPVNDLTPAAELAARVAEAETVSTPPSERTPTSRGFRGKATGYTGWIQPPDEWRGTSVQVCGLWPFASGTGTPMIGVPVGRNLLTGGTLCCDPLNWFMRAQLISNPSLFVLGIPGIGKSAFIKRLILGLSGYGTMPLVLGDLKGEYRSLVRALGGQVLELGRGRGHLNILDPGEATAAAERLRANGHEQAATALIADARGRRHTMVSSLITIMRSAAPNDREETILDRALRVLDERHDGVPVLADLLAVIQSAPEQVRQVALDRGSDDRYRDITEHLEATLIGLVEGGRLGTLFSRQTSEPMRRDSAVVYDVSSIDDSDSDLQAAALLGCWSTGFGMVATAHALADAGLEPRRHYSVVMDELWRGLRAGPGMVDRVDRLGRTNRTVGVCTISATHTMADLLSLRTEDDRMKAKGLVERSGMVVCGGLPQSEMPMLTSVVPMALAEQQMLMSWSAPPAWDNEAGGQAEPPGRGKFLVKVGGRPGIPFRVQLTEAELEVTETNERWMP